MADTQHQRKADSDKAWKGFVPTAPRPAHGLPADRNMFYGDLHAPPQTPNTPSGAMQIERYFACYGSGEEPVCLGAVAGDTLLRWLPEVNGWVADPTVSGTFPVVRPVSRAEADELRRHKVGAFSDEGRLHLYLNSLPGRGAS